MPWIDDLPAEIADSISDEQKANPIVTKYNTFGDFLDGAINTAASVGNSLRVPGPDAPQSDVDAYHEKLIGLDPKLMLKPDFAEPEQGETFYKMLGKPEEAGEYPMPEGATLPDDVQKEMREIAFEANMTKEQFQNWAKGMETRHNATVESLTEQNDNAWKELNGKWGTATEERKVAARKMAEEFGNGIDLDGLTAQQTEMFYSIYEGAVQPAEPMGGMTVDEVREQAAEIMRKVHDPESGLSHGEKMKLIEKRTELLVKHDPRFKDEAA
jgi:hypothetical protein